MLSAYELAAILDIPVNWIYVQIRHGRLLINRQASGAHLFPNTPSAIEAVRKLRNHKLDQLDLRITQLFGFVSFFTLGITPDFPDRSTPRLRPRLGERDCYR